MTTSIMHPQPQQSVLPPNVKTEIAVSSNGSEYLRKAPGTDSNQTNNG